MTIRTTQLSMGYSNSWSASTWSGTTPTCSSCGHRFITTERQGTFPAGSLKCTKGGFITQPLATCNQHAPGEAMHRDPAVNQSRRISIGPGDV